MLLPDVNVLIHAYRAEQPDHPVCARLLEDLVNGDQAYGMSDLVLSSFLRIVTHPNAFRPPSPREDALVFVGQLRDASNCVQVQPGERHWPIFTRLCREANARGSLVADAYLAALAMEHGCTWVTTDRDFSRFPGLDWRHPFA